MIGHFMDLLLQRGLKADDEQGEFFLRDLSGQTVLRTKTSALSIRGRRCTSIFPRPPLCAAMRCMYKASKG